MPKSPTHRGRTPFIIGFLGPAVVLYGVFVVLPLLQAFALSLYRFRGVSTKKEFIGLQNFTEVAHDDVFWKALQNNLWLLVVGGIVILVLSLALAHGMQHEGRVSRGLRSIYLFPQVISLVVVAVLWMFMFNPSYGPVTQILKFLHAGDFANQILGDPESALPAVGVAFVWYALGFYIMLFSAGLRSIPGEVVEAAELDGSNGMHRFRTVTWPMLWSIKRVAVIYIVINVMNVFTLVYLMTEGGPDRASEVMLTYLYKTGFREFEFGRATALAVANFVVAMLLAVIVMVVLRRDPTEGSRRKGREAIS